MISGPVFLLMFICTPETSASTILLRRARRLRRVLKNEKLRSQSEIDQSHMNFKTITYNALLIPWKINFLDPAVAFSTIYTALIYGIYYSFCKFHYQLFSNQTIITLYHVQDYMLIIPKSKHSHLSSEICTTLISPKLRYPFFPFLSTITYACFSTICTITTTSSYRCQLKASAPPSGA